MDEVQSRKSIAKCPELGLGNASERFELPHNASQPHPTGPTGLLYLDARRGCMSTALDSIVILDARLYVERGHPWREWDRLRREAPV